MSTLLEVKGLCVNYGKAEALRGISFRVDRGEVVALIGANGAGKTSTMKALSGLIVPLAGEIWFHGERIDGMAGHERVRLGIAHIPEGRRVFGALTVQQNLQMGAYTRHEKKAVTEDMERIYITFPALREKSAQPAQALSGGQQQMLAIARAMAGGPQILILDEPTEGIQPSIVQEIHGIVRDLNTKTGLTILLVEQNIDFALTLSTRGYIVEKGQVVSKGSVDDLKEDSIVKNYLTI